MSNLTNLIQDLITNAVTSNTAPASNNNASAGGGLGGLGNVLGGLLGGQSNQGNQGGVGGMLGSVLGGLTGQNQQAGGQSKLLLILIPFVLNWVQKQGGFQQALASLTQSGLGQQVQSWVSNGENQPVQPSQLAGVFPEPEVEQVAAQAGTSTNEVYSTIAAVLPQVVNAITANGQATGNGSTNQIQQVLGMLGGLKL